MSTIIELDGLSYKASDKVILSDIDLNVSKGDFLSITGPSGSGKSTLLKIVASLLSKSSGSFYFEGKAIEEIDPVTYRKAVSYCFQSPVLFGETVSDNLSFPFKIRNVDFDKDRAEKMLASVGLEPIYLDKKITELSGGEKQRVALIRNIIFTPKVLLLDEVTSALDEENRKIIWKWLHSIYDAGDLTILMVSHNQEEAQLAPHSIEIKNGKITERRGF
ncbi:MAG: ABC transporter ATP-binding protein [Bavariicoccus seileri]|uniref:Spermidine/putrescine ABC transporter ATP-binding protein n=1 Tax=Bavariicoccus seileri TaxID=549685 RepID=A0A3D4S5K6_9ENTE|nr:ATP-binding cassette domain-containing protein [Bavariicoccus seileri]HCS93916.1 spermidine/putrescine ABC transporter ATP-binding protein [Bavariicoccus seileri]